jgi:hypothetical protein
MHFILIAQRASARAQRAWMIAQRAWNFVRALSARGCGRLRALVARTRALSARNGDGCGVIPRFSTGLIR